MKRAQVQQVDEYSSQKSTENHETVQQLTFQLQLLQEEMNSTRFTRSCSVVSMTFCCASSGRHV